MAILKGKIKTETGDILYPETSADKVVGLDEASTDITDSSMSKVSGISDGLALPKQSQMEMLSIKGNTVAWNQIFPISQVPSTTFKGITYTNNRDGSYTFSGSAEETFEFWLFEASHIAEDGKFLACGVPSTASASTHYLKVTNFGDMITGAVIGNRIYGSMAVYVHIEGGATLNNVTYAPKLISLTQAFPVNTPTELSDPRVQWCINYALLHPEFASKLVDVDLTAYETTGRNLLSGQTVTNNYGDTGILIGVCGKSGIYTFNANETVGQINIDEIEEDGTSLGTAATVGNNSVLSATLVAGKRYGIWCNKNSNWSYATLIKDKLMMNYGSTALPYEPYVKHDYPLSWNGKSAGSVYDEKLANGKEITRVRSYTFTGNEAWTAYSSAGQYDTYSSDSLSLPAPSLADLSGEVICSNGYAHVSGVYSGTALGIGIDYNRCYISIPSGANPNDVFHAGTIMNYQLLTPIETDGDPLPNAIAVYQDGTEWQINDGAPATITKNYDISIKDQVLTNVKVDARQEEEIEELRQSTAKKTDINGTLLWENGNPNASFAEHTDSNPIVISSSSKYRYLILAFKINIQSVSATEYIKCLNSSGDYIYTSKIWQSGLFSRRFRIENSAALKVTCLEKSVSWNELILTV